MTTIQEVSSNGYKEKTWGKDVGNGYVTDGYAFRGKRAFKKAWDGLKEHMKKGIKYEIGVIK